MINRSNNKNEIIANYDAIDHAGDDHSLVLNAININLEHNIEIYAAFN